MIDESTKSGGASSSSSSTSSSTDSSSSSGSKSSSTVEKIGAIGKPKVIAAVVAISLVIIVILQNTGPTKVDVLFWSVELPRWILLSLHFAAGAAAGVLIPRWRKRRKEKRPLVG